MAEEPLEVGFVGMGMIVDGIDDTAWVSGTVTYDEQRGVSLQVPFIGSRPGENSAAERQFGHVREWFHPSNPSPPHHLDVELEGRAIGMFDCRWTRTSGSVFGGLSFGTVAAENVVTALRTAPSGDFPAPLLVHQFRSRLDGLARLTRFSSIHRSTTHNDDEPTVRAAHIDVESGESLGWQQGEASMTIGSTWTVGGPDNRILIEDDVVLVSEFSDARPIEDHLAEHRKVQRLLTVLVGLKMNFRSHELRDPTFAVSYGEGFEHSTYHYVVNRWTNREHRSPVPEDAQLARALLPIVNANSPLNVGAQGLERWSEKQGDWERVVLPLVNRLGSAGAIEDQVTTAGMCLEAAGHVVGHVPGEEDTYWRGRPTTATYSFRVLADLGIVLAGPAVSARALARGIANNYNDLKHFDRGKLPDPVHTYLVSRIATLLVRAYLAKLVLNRPEVDEDAEPFATTFDANQRLDEVRRDFEAYGLRIGEKGKFEPHNAAPTT